MSNTCGNSNIVGVSFSLHPMCDDFVNVILEALNHTDTSKVWMETDDVATVIRGKSVHIFDVSQAIFMHAAKTGEHVAFNATYSVGCPGDSTGDAFMAKDDEPVNRAYNINQQQSIAAKFSLYPLNGNNYMDLIYSQIDAMKKHVHVERAHYGTRLDGEANQIFKGLEQAFLATIEHGSSHTVMTVSISANSPSHKEDL